MAALINTGPHQLRSQLWQRNAWTTGIALIICLQFAGSWPALADERKLDARELVERGVSENLRLAEDGLAIELERGELFEDDGPAAGYSYKPNEEVLSPNVWIRKELIVPNPQATSATLLVGSGGDLAVKINGQPQTLKSAGPAGSYWKMFTFPPAALQAGKNEIILHGSGKVWIARDDEFAGGSRTRTRHPNRSAKSRDAGKTWDDQHLGTAGNVDGEYYVRLFLDHVRPRGQLTTPVIDAGNLAGKPLAAPVESIGPVHVRVEGESAATSALMVRVRSGANPLPGTNTWTAWQALESTGGTFAATGGRYIQLSVELNSTDGEHSSRLKHLSIEAAPKRFADWTGGWRVVESHNEEIVRSSIPFEYESFSEPRLKQLREQFNLDDVIKGAEGDLELISRLAGWSARQWEKMHLGEAYPPWNALDVLQPHQDGHPVGGFCQQYNLVLLQACLSFGLTARPVSIGPDQTAPKIRGGHEVVEIWSNDFKKWIYVDGNMAWYFVDGTTSVPLSLWELRQRQLPVLQGGVAPPVRLVRVGASRREWNSLADWPGFADLRLIPRNNFLTEQAPLPLNQGMRGWFWTGHHIWTDAANPAPLLYCQRVSQRRNFEWTLNQAHYTLEAMKEPGQLRVHLDTETPGFETFLARINGGDLQPVNSGFLWTLQRGRNTLEVQPRNTAGRNGIRSRVVLDQNPD